MIIGLTLSTSNLLGYMRCKLGKTDSTATMLSGVANQYLQVEEVLLGVEIEYFHISAKNGPECDGTVPVHTPDCQHGDESVVNSQWYLCKFYLKLVVMI